MRTPRRTNRFNQRELTRVIRAAKAAGIDVERYEVDPATEKISVIPAKPGSAESIAGAKAWDEATARIERKSKVSESAPTRR